MCGWVGGIFIGDIIVRALATSEKFVHWFDQALKIEQRRLQTSLSLVSKRWRRS